MRDRTKSWIGHAVGAIAPQCRWDRSVFILAHMRCGSTALSSTLCSRPEISGYGETHVAYRERRDLGRLVMNQLLRQAWKPRSRYLFDKLLHNRHDEHVPPEFFHARAIFLCREPEPTIRSIRQLFIQLGKNEYVTDAEAAEYYIARLDHLGRLWDMFPPHRRLGLTYEALIADIDGGLAGVSELLEFEPPLTNAYESHSHASRGGGGDPTNANQLKRIVRLKGRGEEQKPMDMDPLLIARARTAFDGFITRMASSGSVATAVGAKR